MLSVFKKRHPPVGARPGTLVVSAGSVPPRMHAFTYDATGVAEQDVPDAASAKALLKSTGVTWVDIQGLGDEATLRAVAAAFGMHLLALEDVVNVPQRPKIESYGEQQLLVTRMIRLREDSALDIEQVSLVFGPGYLLSFQERYGDVLDPVRRRLRDGLGPMRRLGSDYLAYALLDTIVDGYYPIIEQLGEQLADLEHNMMRRIRRRDLDQINQVRNSLAGMARAILPQREALTRLLRENGSAFSKDVLVYLRDTLDHCAQLADVVDSHRDLASGLLNTYLSLVGMRTNDVMKVLTIMSSIFIPLTFMAGIYGMNFDAMPELHEPWAYPALLLVMVATAVAMLAFFWRRGWLSGEDEDDTQQ